MSALLGTIVNAAAIILGSLAGTYLVPAFSREVRDGVMHAIGLVVLVMGLDLALQSASVMLLLLSIVVGAVIGSAVGIQRRLTALAERFENHSRETSERTDVVDAIVLPTLIFCVGPLAILGALEGGLQGVHTTLFVKAVLDGTASLVFATSFGVLVVLTAIPVFVYQGAIVLLAQSMSGWLEAPVLQEITAVGGVMILAIALNLLDITELKVADLTPALVVVVLLYPLLQMLA